MPEVTLVEAVNLALARAMADDASVVVLRRGRRRQWRRIPRHCRSAAALRTERVIDTPLAELLISGLVRRHGGQGLKPVGEIQFMGFIYPCIDQLVNHASRLRNRTQGRLSCPMVLRTPHGGGIRAPEHHSESTEAMLAHIPGPARGDPVFAGACLWIAARRDPRSRSGRFPRADAHLSRRPKAKSMTTARRCRWMSRSCCERAGRHVDQLGRDGARRRSQPPTRSPPRASVRR